MTSRVTHSEVTREGLAYVVRNLRPRDRQEIFALRWNDDEDQFCAEVFNVAGDLWKQWYHDGVPAAVTGVVPVRPGVVIGGAFGTSQWRRVLRPMTRWARDYVIPVLKMSDFHRIEAYVLASNSDSRRWLQLLGADVESLLKSFGRQREDFFLYVLDLTQEEKRHVLLQRKGSAKRTQDGHRLSS